MSKKRDMVPVDTDKLKKYIDENFKSNQEFADSLNLGSVIDDVLKTGRICKAYALLINLKYDIDIELPNVPIKKADDSDDRNEPARD